MTVERMNEVSVLHLETNFDIVLIFDIDDETGETSQEALDVIHILILKLGRKYVYEFNTEHGEKFVLFRGGGAHLKEFAERSNFNMLLDPELTAAALQKGNEELSIASVRIEENYEVTPIFPYDYIYVRYKKRLDHLYWKAEDSSNPFTGSTRLKLMNEFIRAPEVHGGLGLNLRNLMTKGVLKSYFHLHNLTQKSKLASVWLKLDWLSQEPLNMIRNYFGERISLLTGFYSYFGSSLILPSLIGVAFQVMSLYYDDWSRYETPVFAYFLSLWMVWFTHNWKRKVQLLNLYWGKTALPVRSEDRRPQHYGYASISFIDGSPDLYFPLMQQHLVLMASVFVTALILICFIGFASGIYYVRTILGDMSSIGTIAAQWIASGITAVHMELVGLAIPHLARILTNMENHRTDANFETSYSVKLFVFRFVSTFATFYYLAFGASYLNASELPYLRDLGGCWYDDCMKTLAINMVAVVGCRLILHVNFGVLLPMFLYRPEPELHQGKVWLREQAKKSEHVTGYEVYEEGEEGDDGNIVMEMECDAQFEKDQYSLLLDWNNDISVKVVDLLLVSLFSTALPATPAMFLFCAPFCMFGFTWRFLFQYRRPMTLDSRGLGVWEKILDLCCVLVVLTNAALVSFTMLDFNSWNATHKLLLFLAFQWSLLGFHFVLNTFCTYNEDSDIHRIQKQRAAFIEQKLVFEVPDSVLSPTSLL